MALNRDNCLGTIASNHGVMFVRRSIHLIRKAVSGISHEITGLGIIEQPPRVDFLHHVLCNRTACHLTQRDEQD